jgi:hypothetical protein
LAPLLLSISAEYLRQAHVANVVNVVRPSCKDLVPVVAAARGAVSQGLVL